MKRISSEAEFYENGAVVIDADGVVIDLGAVETSAAIAAFEAAIA